MKLKILSYIIVTCVLLFFMSLPTFFTYLGAYAAPPSVYAQNILANGHIASANFISSSHHYWASAIQSEIDYPLPALLLSEITLITGIPTEFMIFLPIVALASIIYFVLAAKILDRGNKSGLSFFFASIFFLFMVFTNLQVTTIERATLGVTLFAFIILCYYEFIRSFLSGKPRFSWFILLAILTVSLGYCYYTAILGILVLTLTMGLIVFSAVLLFKRQYTFPALAITVLSSFMFLLNPFLKTVTANVTISTILSNAFTFIKSSLHIESQENSSWLLFYGYKYIDPLTARLNELLFAVRVISIISIFICLIIFLPKLQRHTRPSDQHAEGSFPVNGIWLFSLIILLASIGEIAYLALGSLNPFRWIMTYGVLALLYLILYAIDKKSNTASNGLLGKRWRLPTAASLKFSKKGLNWVKILAFAAVAVVLLASFGGLANGWLYGSASAKPYEYQQVIAASEFLLANCPIDGFITITGDADYTSTIFNQAALANKTSNLVPEPLSVDAVTLYQADTSGNTTRFFCDMNLRNIHYLLTVDKGTPLWGDGWGYTVTTDFVNVSKHCDIIYDGKLQVMYFSG